MTKPRRLLLATGAALLLTAGTAAAQVSGGIGFPSGPIPGAAMAQALSQVPRLPVSVAPNRRGAPPGAMVTNPSASRSSVHQQSITRIRGDAGFLAGFSKGQPLAPSRQAPVPADPALTLIEAPFIVNNFNSALNFAFGDGNLSQQQLGDGSGAAPAGPSGPAPQPQPQSQPQPQPQHEARQHREETAQVPDPLMRTAGPLPHLPFALENGGVQFNNLNSSINLATGTGNRATQTVTTVQR
ncbi:hypothetical protein [Azospirillum picis]|uniref:Uncharacterized protein n=1 Tax=Azospirillum picis TaxID=488438 RepID=A0ABU0MQV9_9PROT|nr:hypothetical protein [Azospirillum picis]MBP2302105.1 hypothetical protein [Azospirillum picis]MDQ0535604.1 hypothetical protein [Azospirillum picis]